MLKILNVENALTTKNMSLMAVLEILADTEEDITEMGGKITEGGTEYGPLPGSMACTADGAACYVLSPSNVWTKVVRR